jgi:hypothetical protein
MVAAMYFPPSAVRAQNGRPAAEAPRFMIDIDVTDGSVGFAFLNNNFFRGRGCDRAPTHGCDSNDFLKMTVARGGIIFVHSVPAIFLFSTTEGHGPDTREGARKRSSTGGPLVGTTGRAASSRAPNANGAPPSQRRLVAGRGFG